MSRNSGNMGNPAELEANQRPTSQTKATFSGATAFLGVLSLIITIISVAVPHWGYFGPSGQSYFAQGKFVFFGLVNCLIIFMISYFKTNFVCSVLNQISITYDSF